MQSRTATEVSAQKKARIGCGMQWGGALFDSREIHLDINAQFGCGKESRNLRRVERNLQTRPFLVCSEDVGLFVKDFLMVKLITIVFIKFGAAKSIQF